MMTPRTWDIPGLPKIIETANMRAGESAYDLPCAYVIRDDGGAYIIDRLDDWAGQTPSGRAAVVSDQTLAWEEQRRLIRNANIALAGGDSRNEGGEAHECYTITITWRALWLAAQPSPTEAPR
jgi:hypothetical protein